MLQELLANPNDDLAWKAYHDYLEENGQPWHLPTITNSIGMRLLLIPPGRFLMGSPDTEANRSTDEGPQHEVKIAKAFYLGIYTVTQAQWRVVMGNNPSYFCAAGEGKNSVEGLDTDHFPVERVSWEDAQQFCAALSALPAEKAAGRVYRLPTECEWEYTCRAGTTTPFHFGESLSSKQANFDGSYPYGDAEEGPYLQRTCQVGSYPGNAWGLHDMHGNVWEWCADWYTPYREGEQRSDPIGSSGEVAGTTTAGTAGQRSAVATGPAIGTSATGSGLLPEGEQRSDPTGCSGAAAGTTTAGAAGQRTASATGPAVGTGTTGSGSQEGEQGSDPTEYLGADAGTATAGTAGLRPASAAGPTFGTSSTGSESPPGDEKRLGRVLRGGSWFNDGKICRSAYRNCRRPGVRDRDCGFRVALQGG